MHTTILAPARRAETTIEILNVTTAYRARITWADGRTSTIGDWPTRRMAIANAGAYIINLGRPELRRMPTRVIDRT